MLGEHSWLRMRKTENRVYYIFFFIILTLILSSFQPDMQPVGVVDAEMHSQIPGLPSSLHILVCAVGHYPDPVLCQSGDKILQESRGPAPGSFAQYKFEVDVLFACPKVEMEIRSSFGADYCVVNFFQDLFRNGIGAIGLDVNLLSRVCSRDINSDSSSICRVGSPPVMTTLPP